MSKKYTFRRIDGYKCKWWVYGPDNFTPFNLPSREDAHIAISELNDLDLDVALLEAANAALKRRVEELEAEVSVLTRTWTPKVNSPVQYMEERHTVSAIRKDLTFIIDGEQGVPHQHHVTYEDLLPWFDKEEEEAK